MNSVKESMKLYAVTDRTWLEGRSLTEVVEEAVQAGVTCVQLREKHAEFEEFVALGKEMKAMLAPYGVPLIINDRVDVAAACGADGVHVGQQDMELTKTRAVLGTEKIIGVSTRTVEQAQKAQADGADYIGVGAVFGTTTKADAKKVSVETLQAITEAVAIPVVAIGGVTKDNLIELAGSGVDGVAVVSSLFAQKEIAKAAKELKEQAEAMLATR